MPGLLHRLATFLFLLIAGFATASEPPRPYIGFAYPAGAQQGTTIRIRLGGQDLNEVQSVLVTGSGVSAVVAENYWRLDMQELQLLNEQLRALRLETLSDSVRAELMSDTDAPMTPEPSATNAPAKKVPAPVTAERKEAARKLIDHIEQRTLEYVLTPACPAIASLVLVDVTVAPDADPGERELRLVTLRGVSNPLSFHVGQLPEHSRDPMATATLQVLGKESQALRKRLPGETEESINVPCTVNGQVASGEINQYRFAGRKGQRLVITTLARQLVPFIADAVPGWFQPVLTLYDSAGKELAYGDDYLFKPDPVIFFEVPADGEYVITIHDSLYRGREDFVYRISIGELPFITSVFPLGGRVGTALNPQLKGWNLEDAALASLPAGAGPGIHYAAADARRRSEQPKRTNGPPRFISNRVPLALDELPEAADQEPNNSSTAAQRVSLPLIINGRIDQPGDWDVFQFSGLTDQSVVVEVQARRLDSPLDSVVKLTDAAGNLLAFNDDHEDLGAGLNTHHADSYFLARLPAGGMYCVHIGDTARHGGQEFAYRLRISPPRPDFELRVVPSSLGLRGQSSGSLAVYAQRKDGFTGPIQLALKDPPPGFSAAPATLPGTTTVERLEIKTTLSVIPEPLTLSVIGTAAIDGREVTRTATPAEDRMQAFLWRHLVPAKDLKVLVFDPAHKPPPKRIAGPRPPPPPPAPAVVATNAAASTNAPPERPRFTKEQVVERLAQIKRLFEEGMFTDDFYWEKVAECEAAQ